MEGQVSGEGGVYSEALGDRVHTALEHYVRSMGLEMDGEVFKGLVDAAVSAMRGGNSTELCRSEKGDPLLGEAAEGAGRSKVGDAGGGCRDERGELYDGAGRNGEGGRDVEIEQEGDGDEEGGDGVEEGFKGCLKCAGGGFVKSGVPVWRTSERVASRLKQAVSAVGEGDHSRESDQSEFEVAEEEMDFDDGHEGDEEEEDEWSARTSGTLVACTLLEVR